VIAMSRHDRAANLKLTLGCLRLVTGAFAILVFSLIHALSGDLEFTDADYDIISRNPDLRLLIVRDPLLLRNVLEVIKGEEIKSAEKQVPDSVLEVAPALCNEMKQRHVLNSGAPVGCDRLRLVKFSYIDFDGRLHNDGEIIVLDAIASHVANIFATLRERAFPIAKAKLVDAYGGNDDASMADNNTSSFNVRPITGGKAFSLHAYGLAIDLNPVQNPYVRRTITSNIVKPKSGSEYLNRKLNRRGMAESVRDTFANHGLTIWGGMWSNPTDYQHFQVSQKLANRLAALPTAEATALFERHVQDHRACVQAESQSGPTHPSCSALD
jgi:hypothetical protein